MPDATQAVAAALVVTVVLLLGTTMVSDLTDGEDGIRTSEQGAALLDDTSTFIPIDDGEGYGETVYDSRGWAVNLTGADDSYVESKDGFEIASDGTWTVSVWAHVDNASSGETMTALSLNGRVVVSYNGSAGNWSVWYYDEAARDSYQVNVSATSQPGNLTNIQAVSNGTHLTVYRNNSTGGVVNMSGDSITEAPVNESNWDGRLDEVRTFDDALNGSQRGSVYNDSVGPLANATRTSRIMFDQPNRSVQLVFFADTSSRQSNVSYSGGLPGEELTPASAILQQSDYEWEATGPRIRPVAGGELEGAPVAYVDYTLEDALADVISGWSDMVGVAALVPVLAVVAVIVVRLRGV